MVSGGRKAERAKEGEEKKKEERKRKEGTLRKMVQIFVKVDESKETPMEASLADDKVEDVMRRIPNGEDVYVTTHGRTLKSSEKLNSCGVSDGCTIQVTSRMRGEEGTRIRRARRRRSKPQAPQRHRSGSSRTKKRETEVQRFGSAIKDATIRMMEETEGYPKIVKMPVPRLLRLHR